MSFFSDVLQFGAAFVGGGPAGLALSILNRATGGAGQDGPRLTDLNIALDGEGQPIAKTWGVGEHEVRLVWTTGLTEKKKTHKSGGLFGTSLGASKSTTYIYGAKSAGVVGRGQMTRPRRVRLNQYPVYDWNGGDEQGGDMVWKEEGYWECSTRLKDDKSSTVIRIFPGTLHQPVPPLIAEDKGENQWTNYPGQMIIEVNIPDTERYGRSMPRIRVEFENDSTALSDVILEIASWKGYGPDKFDLSALAGITVAPTDGEGLTANSRRSAANLIEELMDTYNFSLPEEDGVFVAKLDTAAPVTTISLRDQRIHTPETATPDTLLIEDDEESLPEIMETTFFDVGRENAVGYRYARRRQHYESGADNGATKRESFTLSGSFRGARAARNAQIRLGKRWAARRKVSLTWGLKHLYLGSGDRVLIESPLGDGELLDVRLPKLNLPLFGAVDCVAPLNDPLLFDIPLGPETSDLARRTPIEPGTPIVFAAECPFVNDGGFWTSNKAFLVAMCRSIGDAHWNGGDINIDIKEPDGEWKRASSQDGYANEAVIGELTAPWTPSGFGTLDSFSAQVWGGSLTSNSSGAQNANLILFENGVAAAFDTATQTAVSTYSRFYSLSDVHAGVLGSDALLTGDTLPSGTRFVLICDENGDYDDGPEWKKFPAMPIAGTELRVNFGEDDTGETYVMWEMGVLQGQNVKPPSPTLLETTRTDEGLTLAGTGRTRFIEDMALDGTPDTSVPYREYVTASGFKYEVILTCDGASASRVSYTTDERAAFSWSWTNSQLATLLGKTEAEILAGDITGTVALYGALGIGRAATFTASAPAIPTP